jgi:hypothetical protein
MSRSRPQTVRNGLTLYTSIGHVTKMGQQFSKSRGTSGRKTVLQTTHTPEKFIFGLLKSQVFIEFFSA